MTYSKIITMSIDSMGSQPRAQAQPLNWQLRVTPNMTNTKKH